MDMTSRFCRSSMASASDWISNAFILSGLKTYFLLCWNEMLLKMVSRQRGSMPRSCWLPVIVCVLPEPVTP